MSYYVFAMLVLRGPQGRLVLPTESPSLNKVITYLLTNKHYTVSEMEEKASKSLIVTVVT